MGQISVRFTSDEVDIRIIRYHNLIIILPIPSAWYKIHGIYLILSLSQIDHRFTQYQAQYQTPIQRVVYPIIITRYLTIVVSSNICNDMCSQLRKGLAFFVPMFTS